MVAGIRAGKSTALAATITVYEATCGGHEEHTRKDRPVICFQIAQDLRFAKYSLHTIKGIIESMPWCKSWITDVTAERIDLKNHVTVVVTPPTIKSLRGYDSPVSVLDEIAIWYTEADSANPDIEVYNTAVSRQAQFEFPKIVGISSPWSKQGLLHRRYEAGTDGCKIRCNVCVENIRDGLDCEACKKLRRPHQNRLVLHSTSAGLGSPAVKDVWLKQQLEADPRNFARECLAIAQESISGFLDVAKLESAVDHNVIERIPDPKMYYVAAMDPAFRHDSFAFAVGHVDPAKGVVIDVIRRWVPVGGGSLNPAEILADITVTLRDYRVFTVYSDQYQFESLQQLAMNLGFSIEPVDFTASSKSEIYGNLKSLVNQRRIRLLDEPTTLREIKQLEQKLTQAGNVQIGAPKDQHDDLATVVALIGHKSIWMLPAVETPAPKLPTDIDIIKAQVEAKQQTRFVGRDENDEW